MFKLGIVTFKITTIVGTLLIFLPSTPLKFLPAPGQAQTAATLNDGCGTMSSNFGDDRCMRISFAGEITANHNFDREIGRLRFRLNSQNASFGWNIEVNPPVEANSKDSEYIWPVTPPYHFGNVRYLDTSYGVRAEAAVKMSPRDFNFVLDQDQFNRAADLVNLAASSRPLNEHKSQADLDRESKDALNALESLPVGKGRLEIVDSRINKSGGSNGLGAIEWLKFSVELHVPCNFETTDSADISLDRGKCPNDRKKPN
jgi:hypothetical protein